MEVHIQTLAVIKKKKAGLKISIKACWQGSTDARSGFLMFGRICLLPPIVTSFSLYVEETLLKMLI